MDLSGAVAAIKIGRKVRRAAWDREVFIQEITEGDLQYPVLFDHDDNVGGYLWNEEDCNATDWEVK